ncbi:MAG: hypothetical protein K8F91_01545 [Candidatus Obscuribacterales bacterium]|nr:hypothetical protein [Candidatus Obscuribacterales bacterium]
MSNQYVEDWIGSEFGDYTIQELVGEGTFSLVFRAVDRAGGAEKAIKIPRAYIPSPDKPNEFVPTQVFIKRRDRYSPQEASPVHIQKIQVARTRDISDLGLVSVDKYSFEKGKAFSRMPLLSGQTFRQYLRAGPVPVSLLGDIASTLARLNDNDDFGYHGDVKPENMIVTTDGVVLVDCGYFGSIEMEEDVNSEHKALIVTTPRYYPHLKADDLLAFGLILWESACRESLLTSVAYSRDFELDKVKESLIESVHQEEDQGNFNFSQIMDAKRPSWIRPGLPDRIENLLLKATRLKFDDDDCLDLVEGYESFAEIEKDLSRLVEVGIHYV